MLTSTNSGARPLRLSLVRADSETLLSIAGELDIASAWYLDEALSSIPGDERRPVVWIDMAAVSFMDCAGVDPIVRASRTVEGSGGSLGIVSANGQPRRLLHLLRLEHLLP